MISGISEHLRRHIVINGDTLKINLWWDSPRSVRLRRDTHQRFRAPSPRTLLKIHNSPFIMTFAFCALTFVWLLYCPPPPPHPHPSFFNPISSPRWLNTLPCRLTFTSHLFRFYVALCKLECKYGGFHFKPAFLRGGCGDDAPLTGTAQHLGGWQETGRDPRVKRAPVQRTTHTFPFILG